MVLHHHNLRLTKNKKDGCKISIVPVSLPDYQGTPLNLVICNGLGRDPLLLLASLESSDPRLCVTVTKVYLMRWRIEEYYRFKKQEFGFEKFLVRSLKSIRNLDMLKANHVRFEYRNRIHRDAERENQREY